MRLLDPDCRSRRLRLWYVTNTWVVQVLRVPKSCRCGMWADVRRVLMIGGMLKAACSFQSVHHGAALLTSFMMNGYASREARRGLACLMAYWPGSACIRDRSVQRTGPGRAPARATLLFGDKTKTINYRTVCACQDASG